MCEKTMDKNTNLVWIDLEMTGLVPATDVILEIALIITDGNLTVLHEGPSLVIHQPDGALERMDAWVKKVHTASGLVSDVRSSTCTVERAEQEVLEVIRQYCDEKKGILCGNSVWQDRLFLRTYMPRITDYLHYRLLDVTAFKVALDRWYPDRSERFFAKQDKHRAMIDIKESIAELQYYRSMFFK